MQIFIQFLTKNIWISHFFYLSLHLQKQNGGGETQRSAKILREYNRRTVGRTATDFRNGASFHGL